MKQIKKQINEDRPCSLHSALWYDNVLTMAMLLVWGH